VSDSFRATPCVAQTGCALCGWEEVDEAADLAPGLFDGAHVGLSEEGDLTAMVEAVTMANPEAILVLCTNLRAGPLVPESERRLGITVLDSVGTALWDALRVAGVPPRRVDGWGRLFDDAV